MAVLAAVTRAADAASALSMTRRPSSTPRSSPPSRWNICSFPRIGVVATPSDEVWRGLRSVPLAANSARNRPINSWIGPVRAYK